MPWPLRMSVTILLLLIIPYIYVGFRLSRAISNIFSVSPASVRIGTFAIVLLLILFPILILLHFVSGNVQDFFVFQSQLHWQDYVFLYPFWLGLIVLIEILPYYLVIDGIHLSFRITKSPYLKYWVKWGSILQICMALFFIFFVGIKSYLDTNKLETKQYKVPIEKLPEGLNDISLVLFGDVQVDRYTQGKDLTDLKNHLQKANGDLLFFAGDLVTYGEEFIDQGLNLLCGLDANLGKFNCLGDHDHWANPERITSGLENCGWNFLKNQHHLISHNNHKILVTGIVFIYSRRLSTAHLERLLGSAPTADLKILLVHQPAKKVVRIAKKYGYHLVLAGHTHGGQIVFKPFGYSLTPSRFENEHFSGYKKDGEIALIVTNGIGLTLAPLRYNARAEISKINLTKKVK